MTGIATATPTRRLGIPARAGLFLLFVLGIVVAAPSGFGLLWFVPYFAVGALLVVRRPRLAIGWVLLALSACFAVVTVTLDATVAQFADGTITPLQAVLAILGDKSGVVAFFLFAVLTIVFPSGRMPRGRWGTITRVALVGGLVLIAATIAMPTISVSLVGQPESIPVRNPLALLPDLAIWQFIGPNVTTFLPIILLLVVAAGSLVVRARTAIGVERQQLRWFTSSVGAVVVAVVGGLLTSALLPALGTSGLVWIPAIVAFPLVPIAIGIAVLRYRLFEIDRIISRTVSWALVTGVLAVAFAATVLAIQALLEGFTQGETLAVAASTLVAFGLFHPVRRRVQGMVDRRFDRARYDGQKVIDAFARQLRDEVDLDRLRATLVATADDVVRPVGATIWLRNGEASP